jgi:DNA-binding response OmpR family regulator
MHKKTVLVVEDNAAMRELLKLHLGHAGYEVIVAEDAIVAGHAVLRSRPDMLIVDANLPYMNGIEFAATLLADSSVPYVPIILISGADVAPQADRLGAPVLRKPFLVHQLVELVESTLSPRWTPAVTCSVPSALRFQ